jgi:glycosyltransferase involved in cell wall biosynthesis
MNTDPAYLPRQAELARDAYSRGQALLVGGDKINAARWLGRAHRLAPGDNMITVAFASASIGTDNPRAALLFAQVLTVADVREAWLGLTTARLLMGDTEAASAALAEALSRHTPHSGMTALADRVAQAAGAAGWCGLTGEGAIVVQTVEPEKVEIRIDGLPIPSGGLPSDWPRAREITVIAEPRERVPTQRHLIGSPISPSVIGRVEGFVESWEGGLRGWAWHPGDRDTDPVLSLVAGAAVKEIVATEPSSGIPGQVPLARPRSFAIASRDLPPGTEPVRLFGRDGRDLLGSPVPRGKPEAVPARYRDSRLGASARRGLAVIVQAHQQADVTRSCLEAVLATVNADVRVLLRDGPALDLRPYRGRVVRWEGAIGPRMDACPDHDVVLLEGGAVLPPGWLERMRDAAYAAPDIGTVTSFSNRGEAAYPTPEGAGLAWFEYEAESAPPRRGKPRDTARDTVVWLDRLARLANGMASVDLPYGSGPCVFIRGDCLAETGPFRSALFAQGHGEQEDFSLRAGESGHRHVALTGLFVGCRLSAPSPAEHALASSPAALGQLRARNTALLEQLHPGLDARVEAYRSGDLLALARRRLDLARWGKTPGEAAIFVTHGDGGGVARRVADAVASQEASGRRAVVLHPSRMPDGTVAAAAGGERFPNLRYALPEERPLLLRLLRDTSPAEVEIHHFLNHDPSVIESALAPGIPYDVHTHDFAWFCPRIALVGRGDVYCGEPDLAACEACVAETGSYLHEDISVTALRERSLDILSGARRVIAPSQDTAMRMANHFPDLTIEVVPHEDDAAIEEPPPIPDVAGVVRVCVAGAIGLHKGFHVLLACARDARIRGLELEFALTGTTIDDQSLLDTGRVFITGRYQPEEAVDLIKAQGAAFAFLPSIWPETWCLALTELWRAGLRVAAFDIGAPAERIRHTGRGFLLPLGLPPSAINDALLNAGRGRSFLPIRRPSAYKPSH